MDPNNSQPPEQNPNISKLEEDLARLTKEAAANPNVTSQPQESAQTQNAPSPLTTPLQSTPTQPQEPSVAPSINEPTPQQPIDTPPPPPNIPVEKPKSGNSLMGVAITLLIIAVLVAVGYVVYSKFFNTPTTQVQAPVKTQMPIIETVPTESPMATDSGLMIVPSSSPSATPFGSSTPSASPQ